MLRNIGRWLGVSVLVYIVNFVVLSLILSRLIIDPHDQEFGRAVSGIFAIYLASIASFIPVVIATVLLFRPKNKKKKRSQA